MERRSQHACVFVAAMALSTSAGCYSTTAVAVPGLRQLHGYRDDGHAVYLREERDPEEYIKFDEKSVLLLKMRDREEKKLALEKVRIDGPLMSGVTREDRQLVHVNLWGVQDARVRNPSPGKGAALFAGIAGGALGATLLYMFYPMIFRP